MHVARAIKSLAVDFAVAVLVSTQKKISVTVSQFLICNVSAMKKRGKGELSNKYEML